MHITAAWLQFVVCAAVIGVAGDRLARYGDALSELTGLSRNWIGFVLIATVTSLPELVTGLSAVALANAPDIAVGDVLGSCVYNLFIFALIELLRRGESPFGKASSGQVLSAGFGVMLLAVAAVALLLSARGMVPELGGVSAASLVLVGLYLVAVRTVHLHERNVVQPARPAQGARAGELRRAVVGYAVAAVTVVAAGVWLPFVGVRLAVAMGWSNTYVGTQFIAFATSVPELATTLAALRLGVVDLALGNLLGSNLFDLLILALDDFAYAQGSIFSAASPLHAVSALTAILMSAAVIVAFVYRPSRRVLNTMSWVGISLLLIYLLNSWVLFRHGQ